MSQARARYTVEQTAIRQQIDQLFVDCQSDPSSKGFKVDKESLGNGEMKQHE